MRLHLFLLLILIPAFSLVLSLPSQTLAGSTCGQGPYKNVPCPTLTITPEDITLRDTYSGIGCGYGANVPVGLNLFYPTGVKAFLGTQSDAYGCINFLFSPIDLGSPPQAPLGTYTVVAFSSTILTSAPATFCVMS